MSGERRDIPEADDLLSKPPVGYVLQDIVLRMDSGDQHLRHIKSSFQTPEKLEPDSERLQVLDYICTEILGQCLEDVLKASSNVLKQSHLHDGSQKTLVISSASSSSESHKTELNTLQTQGHVIDIPGAIEGRDTRTSKRGDCALISTMPGLIMARAKGDVEIINLAEEKVANLQNKDLLGSDLYYKADALLLLILTNPKSPVILSLVNEIKKGDIVLPYNLDEETQIALFWLAKKAGVKEIKVNANSPEVAVELTKKGFKYPTIEDAIGLNVSKDPYKMQFKEWKLSQAAREINHHPDSIPGYLINRSNSIKVFGTKVLLSLMLMASRYRLNSAWSKPDRGTDGGNQENIEIRLQDEQKLERINQLVDAKQFKEALSLFLKDQNLPRIYNRIQNMWNLGGDWVIEAQTNYFEIPFKYNNHVRKLRTAPSVHVIKGEPRSTVSLQLLDGRAWGGNFICRRGSWEKLIGMVSDPRFLESPSLKKTLIEAYPEMPKKIQKYAESVNNSLRYRGGQVRGGADLAIATLGGKFANDLVIGVQDYNPRANGCETAYGLYDQAIDMFGESGEAVTRNITPKADFEVFQQNLPEIINRVNKTHKRNIKLDQVKLVAVSAGWGQFGVIGSNGMDILTNLFLIEDQLRIDGLIV